MRRVIATLVLRGLRLLGPAKQDPRPLVVPQRIIVFRYGGIGDVVAVTGLLQCLRQLYPRAEITLVTTQLCAPIVEGHPAVDKVVVTEAGNQYRGPRNAISDARWMRSLSAEPFDLAISTHIGVYRAFCLLFLRSTCRIGFDVDDRGFDFAFTHRAPYYSTSHPRRRQLEARSVNEHFHDLIRAFRGEPVLASPPRLALTGGEVDQMRKWLKDQAIGEPLVVLLLGGTHGLKIWPVSRFAALAGRVAHELGAHVLVLGGQAEAHLSSHFDGLGPMVHFLAGSLALRQSIAVLTRVDVVIGSDTGLLHAAAALRVPSIGIFGPTSAGIYGYEGAGQRILRGELECIPCSQPVCRMLPRDSHGELPPCLDAVDVESVLVATKRSMTSDSSSPPAGEA